MLKSNLRRTTQHQPPGTPEERTPKLTHLIQKRVPLDQLRKGAREDGMKMLYDSALDKVRQGLTSLEAALTVTMADEE